MKAIFRLTLFSWFHAKTWLVLLALIGASAIVAPYVVPFEVDPSLTAPARSQAIYGFTFILLGLYLPGLAAELGRAQERNNHRLFWRAQGVSDLAYFVAVLGALVVPILILTGAAGLLIGLFGSKDLGTASLTQAMILTGLASSVVLPLAVGLSQRLAATVAAIFAIGVNVAGQYGPAIIEYIRANPRLSDSERTGLESLSAVIPHLRLGDQAERITFAWDTIPGGWFLASVGYLLACGAVSTLVGFLFFRKPRA